MAPKCSALSLRHKHFLAQFLPRWQLLKILLIGLLLFWSALIYFSFPSLSKCDRLAILCDLHTSSPNSKLYHLSPLVFDSREHNLETFVPDTLISYLPADSARGGRHAVLLVKVSDGQQHLTDILEHLFVPYRVVHVQHAQLWAQSSLLAALEQSDSLSFGLIVFERLATYTTLPPEERTALDAYCRRTGTAVIGFLNDGNDFSTEENSLSNVGTLPIYLHRLQTYPEGYYLAKNASILRVARTGRLQPGRLQQHGSAFGTLTSDCCLATLIPKPGYERHYIPVSFTKVGWISTPSTDIRDRSCVLSEGTDSRAEVFQSLVLEDIGLSDGVRRVLFATSSDGFWINSLLVMEAVVHLLGRDVHASPPITVPLVKEDLIHSPELNVPNDLVRWIMIDVDDVFLHGTGVDFTVDDASALLHAQQQWRQSIPGFTFDLGFCGRFFERASRSDRLGYQRLLDLRKNFWWFDHLWNHYQAHKLNESELVRLMRLNKQFALDHDIPVQDTYAVSPHHSGIYPVIQHLYDAWRTVWNIKATSTEQYPRVSMSKPHLGFKFREIQVLPRQTCGIYSRFVEMPDFPGGEKRMRDLVFGGSLFYTVVFNPVSIFMTHMTNYKGDRLALYLFDALFRFVRQWTNLQLATAPPIQLAHFYSRRFKEFGANDLPLYTDPCADPHSLALWPVGRPCGMAYLPRLVIIGPQKTGSTALVHFLRLHSSLIANHYQWGSTFEELQFFSSDEIYARGVHWYMQQFDPVNNRTGGSVVRFEKSASYFTDPRTPRRMHSLIPDARLVVLLRHPVYRAYSWYQHSLARGDPAARLLSFSQLVRYGASMSETMLMTITTHEELLRFSFDSTNSTSIQLLLKAIQHLYNRCFRPGDYASHLSEWLKYYQPSQILPVDADHFLRAPADTLRVVQEFLRLPYILNYSTYLEYNPHKGFFCLRPGHHFPPWPGARLSNQPCLGSGKGRLYQHLDPDIQAPALLTRFYATANKNLIKLFRDHPIWRRWWYAQSNSEYPAWSHGSS
ncbi:heparan sulfate N-deacetylase/N-sulfotransferase [Clonorchis sinensis]|uniref:[heparan sulfate]-glucosamine N-sulfotransferase n=1 Tax=Clonorchis sinensis TaxID=79923 RepID=H2KQ65_CLOSI|nr:heparan sulfate N-deacetylase/N-sulfotransferase [Clonorchis sinensis]